ncbi:MAG: TIGR02266 family protein [Deltaproteobacteria bacterium]|nr:TIGR02266 family protein [Deltaproteobacteria bacterium]
MSNDKRYKDRAPIEVRVEYRTVGSFLSDWTANISQGGVFIQSTNPFKIGTSVRLVFSLPGIPLLFDLNGEVKWVQTIATDEHPVPGMGIEFIHIDESIQKRIKAYVKNYSNEMPETLRPAKGAKSQSSTRTLSGSAPQREEITQPNIVITKLKSSRTNHKKPK